MGTPVTLLGFQFNIGDFIETPVATGTVEAFNRRTTNIRETDGGLTFVTNGKFTIIKNRSREFANTDFRVGVAYGSGADRCLDLVCDEIWKYAEEQPGILQAEPVFKGVHELGDSAVVLRALVRTAALGRWAGNLTDGYYAGSRTRELRSRIPSERCGWSLAATSPSSAYSKPYRG